MEKPYSSEQLSNRPCLKLQGRNGLARDSMWNLKGESDLTNDSFISPKSSGKKNLQPLSNAEVKSGFLVSIFFG